MVLRAGQHGTPSSTAIIIGSVGLSPLMLGLAGVIHEWAIICGSLSSKRAKKWAWFVVLLYHVLVMSAIVLYAIGMSESYAPATASSGKTLARIGIILLTLLWLAMCGTFALLVARNQRSNNCRPLVLSVAVALVILGVRLVYQCVAVFLLGDPVVNPLTGSVALKAVFEFMPGALAILAMVIGGVLSVNKAAGPYRSVSDGQESEHLSQSESNQGHNGV